MVRRATTEKGDTMTEIGEINAKITNLQDIVNALETRIAALEKTLAQGYFTAPQPLHPDVGPGDIVLID